MCLFGLLNWKKITKAVMPEGPASFVHPAALEGLHLKCDRFALS